MNNTEHGRFPLRKNSAQARKFVQGAAPVLPRLRDPPVKAFVGRL
jgi:hypothetical protein